MTLAATILAIVSALLPLLVKWLGQKMEPTDELESLKKIQAKELSDLAHALQSGTATDVASVWARHDRMLLESGLSRPRTGSDHSGLLGDLSKSERNLYGNGGVDVAPVGSRTVPPHRLRTVRTASGMTIPIFD